MMSSKPVDRWNVRLDETLEQAQAALKKDAEWLEAACLRKPDCQWTAAMRPLAQELHSLALQQPLNSDQISQVRDQLIECIETHRIKGMEPVVWTANLLLEFARRET